jgi:hypothetical protein
MLSRVKEFNELLSPYFSATTTCGIVKTIIAQDMV